MSVTAHIIGILIDAGRGGEDILLLAKAMERGDDASLIFAFVDELETINASPESMAAGLCGMAKGILEKNASGYRRAANSNAPSGPNERWGYDGPITPRLPEREWWPLRRRIFERDDFTCQYCGAEAGCADHVIPLSRGGTNDEDNLVACCLPCNSSKCDRLIGEWEGRLTA